ncbi:uncharacterized protein GGS25DRAFT_516627 [Hypoxylon fragiforme]|uniref:uncharacterized protein n=1 Tax=Hypoxylon fragiforme TaxID=63214 RepID=UPI0020C61EE2|nr:uncharacterized protein GGS25DRAFT_516627 [Hypoxylon fragiforme]KAI2613764.1 hypothetical protein GGS25DRAFT_516627 [Hypoxylon fragiforme]
MDDWITCQEGHKHFGRYNAAGVLIYQRNLQTGDIEVLLGQRAQGTDLPGTWSTIGGALDKDEEPEDGAFRELLEETGLERTHFGITAWTTADHGNWLYFTFCVEHKGDLDLTKIKLDTNEITALGWFSRQALDDPKLPLHPGFKDNMHELKFLLPPNINPTTLEFSEW